MGTIQSALRRTRTAVLALASAAFLTACGPETVSYVNLERYMGTWYQVAANEVSFNEGLVGVTADYELLADGTVSVYNRGYQDTLDGPIDDIYGTATVYNKETNAELDVSFPEATMPNLPGPNYLIVVLDQESYQYAAVADPYGYTLFILSRTPQMDTATYEMILRQLEAKDVDTSKLVETLQPDFM